MARRPEWLFDGSPIDDPLGHGERAVRFLRGLQHAASGGPFQLDPWMERLVRMIYGPRWHDGTRRYRMVNIMLPRGSHKTGLGAGLALLHTIGWEKLPLGQVALAACNRGQARIAFDECMGFVVADPRLGRHVRIRDSRHEITHKAKRSTLKAISADAATANGKTSSFVLFDEIHQWGDRRLFDTLSTGLNKVPGSLGIIISQAGVGAENLAADEFGHARRVAQNPDLDPRTLPVLFEAEKGDDWRNENLWRFLNPGLTCSPAYPDIEGMRQMARKAETRPAVRDRFVNDHLNLWLDRTSSPFISGETWAASAGKVDLERLARERVPCWLGVDLSAANDLTAIVAVWPDPDHDGHFLTHPWFFCPAERIDQREAATQRPYSAWARDERVIPTPGETIDLGAVEAKIIELSREFDVQAVAYDPYLSHGIAPRLVDAGVPMVEQRQGTISMMPCISTADRVINGRFLTHPDHPTLNWNVENIEIDTNSLGHKVRLRKPSNNHNLSIDGAIALVMALHHAASGNSARSIYEDETKRPDGPLVLHHEWDFAA